MMPRMQHRAVSSRMEKSGQQGETVEEERTGQTCHYLWPSRTIYLFVIYLFVCLFMYVCTYVCLRPIIKSPAAERCDVPSDSAS